MSITKAHVMSFSAPPWKVHCKNCTQSSVLIWLFMGHIKECYSTRSILSFSRQHNKDLHQFTLTKGLHFILFPTSPSTGQNELTKKSHFEASEALVRNRYIQYCLLDIMKWMMGTTLDMLWICSLEKFGIWANRIILYSSVIHLQKCTS